MVSQVTLDYPHNFGADWTLLLNTLAYTTSTHRETCIAYANRFSHAYFEGSDDAVDLKMLQPIQHRLKRPLGKAVARLILL